MLSTAATQLLRSRGVSADAADLIAETAMTVFRVASSRWLEKRNHEPVGFNNYVEISSRGASEA